MSMANTAQITKSSIYPQRSQINERAIADGPFNFKFFQRDQLSIFVTISTRRCNTAALLQPRIIVVFHMKSKRKLHSLLARYKNGLARSILEDIVTLSILKRSF